MPTDALLFFAAHGNESAYGRQHGNAQKQACGSVPARLAMLLGVFTLAGCASSPPVRVQQVHVPVPVVCQETEPARPVMPTEALALDTTLDAFVAAAIAELERREGYEGQLRAALAACTAPVQ